MSRKVIVLGVALFAVLALVGGWFTLIDRPKESLPGVTGEAMRVAHVYWPGAYWKDVARRKGWFREAGLDVEWIDASDDYFGSLQRMVDGQIDTHSFPPFDFVRYVTQGADLVAVNATDISSGMDLIVAGPGIADIQDLKGKRVGLTLDTMYEYVVDSVLERHGLTAGDIVKIEVPGEDAIAALTSGKVAAVTTWEPLASAAAAAAGGKIIWDSRQNPGINGGIAVFHRRFVDERPGDVQAFVGVWHRAIRFIADNPAEAYAIVAETYGMEPDDVAAFAKLEKILDLRGALNAFNFHAGVDSLHGNAQRINQFLLRKGITETRIDTLAIFDDRFLKMLREP